MSRPEGKVFWVIESGRRLHNRAAVEADTSGEIGPVKCLEHRAWPIQRGSRPDHRHSAREDGGEGAASPWRAAHRNPSALRLGDPLDQRQAEACALMRVR